MEAIFTRMENDGRAQVSHSRLALDAVVVSRAADMCYVGQEHAVAVDLPLDVSEKQDRDAFKRHFDACTSNATAIARRVEISGDRMKVGLTDVAAQVSGFYNSGEAAGISCCQVAFKCLTSPLELPINDGQFRGVDVVLPPGRVVIAVPRRRCGCGWSIR